MQIRKDRHTLKFLGITLLTFIVGLSLFKFSNPVLGVGFIIVGLMFTVMFLRVSTKPPEYFMRDERSVRVNEKAGYHAFWILLACMSMLIMLDWYTDLLYKDVSYPLYMVAMWSWLTLRWYYDQKGFETDA